MAEKAQHVTSFFSGVVNRTATAANNTSGTFDISTFFPDLLESSIPGYGPARRIVLELTGFDVSIFVPLIGLIIALHAGGVYAFNYMRESLEHYCTCSIDISERDEPYEALMRWLNEKGHFRKTRYLRVAGGWWHRIATSQPEKALVMSGSPEEERKNTQIFNTGMRPPTGFEPDEGKSYFWHSGHLFYITLYFKQLKYERNNYRKIRLSCFGTSPIPLKTLIKEAEMLEIEEEATTEVFRPYPGDTEFKSVSSKPVRPLDTVTLDMDQKINIVRDVNDFIRPASKRWYATRGIPYRRGYLFHGPPGTGKTSLSLALAGLFNLSLFTLSIQDPSMTDSRLTGLFDELFEPCIVLLEDVDSAGIGRESSADADKKDAITNIKNGESADKPKRSQVTLAGLLNAIDGVASHEGHVLIMTTNYPEKLDSALKRPGRVDLEVEFSLATSFQAREIFLRMYTDEKPNPLQDEDSSSPSSNRKKAKNPKINRPTTIEEACRERSPLSKFQTCPFMPFEELCELAEAFVLALPEMKLSPAEVQGYLLLHKTNPRAAAHGAAAWAEGVLRKKHLDEIEKEKEKDKKATEDSPPSVEVHKE